MTQTPVLTRHDRRLRPLMVADTVLTAVNGVAYLVLAPWLASLFGLSAGVFVGLGLFLAAVTAYLVDLVRRPVLSVVRVRVQASVNIVWVLASLALLGSAIELTPAGAVWDVLQAVVVAGFAGFQIRWCRAAR